MYLWVLLMGRALVGSLLRTLRDNVPVPPSVFFFDLLTLADRAKASVTKLSTNAMLHPRMKTRTYLFGMKISPSDKSINL